MTLQDRLMDDLKESMRSGDVIRKNAIRMVRAAIKNAEIEMHRPATDEEVESIINKEIKKRAEAIELFARGNRNDLVEEEKAGIVFLEEYLPTQMNDQELEKIIVETLAAEVSERGATRMDDQTSEASMEKRKRDGYF